MKKLCVRFLAISVMVGTLLIPFDSQQLNKAEVYANCGKLGENCVGAGQGTCCPGLTCSSMICVE